MSLISEVRYSLTTSQFNFWQAACTQCLNSGHLLKTWSRLNHKSWETKTRTRNIAPAVHHQFGFFLERTGAGSRSTSGSSFPVARPASAEEVSLRKSKALNCSPQNPHFTVPPAADSCLARIRNCLLHAGQEVYTSQVFPVRFSVWILRPSSIAHSSRKTGACILNQSR